MESSGCSIIRWTIICNFMQKITPCIWFNDNALEAANFYVSVFKGGKILSTMKYPKDSPRPEGTLMTVGFNILETDFLLINGGEEDTFKLSPATSFIINCSDQAEVDYYWEKLGEGGQTMQCGWLTDKYGVTWQVVPVRLEELLTQSDEKTSYKVMQAMLKMIKIDIAELENAAKSP